MSGNKAISRVSRQIRQGTLTALVLLLPTACADYGNTELQQIKRKGELTVLTYNSPTTYYEESSGFAGLEYDMVQAFADSIGVKAKFIVPENPADILPKLTLKEAHMAAAGIAITKQRKKMVLFTPPYQSVKQQLIYHRESTYPPKTIKDLLGRHIEVTALSRYAERLNTLKQKYPKLKWTEVADKGAEELLLSVWQGLLEFTVVDSNIFDLNKPYYPELKVALDMNDAEDLAWAFPLGEDRSLYNAASKFIKKIQHSGELKQLIDKYYGAASRSNPVNMTVYHLRIQNRLPSYQTLFEQAAKKYDLDWRLLAAIGYQESFWDPGSVSPTGVRGIMMLTQSTAKQMGVTDRLDPVQAIDGGARYFSEILNHLPAEIEEPDRNWIALAGYNVGLGHVQDAQMITQQRGGDPNKWNDLRQSLPLLSRYSWYKKTKHGYARGIEPVRFVTRIRNYYEALAKIDDEEQLANRSKAIKLKAPAI